ncbi:hypothetical protein [Wenjunlia tyrosinilytica]|uniref:Uncharacterized protein n=1 Tax=Wenjunlia tyrosinilytica TaxID=1544741 RepID=A0A917ZUU2_9ACTN|nr:hypothetical protein [Wenjunlia tyrosinilytica]GGO95246.1 hypothetical protein GCM10012280_51990 [Wenjunlia tyrosinilytica]
MHTFDLSSPAPYHQIPAMRPAREAPDGSGTTPIYDALYSEYRRLFRALPGDRSGEEDLKFTGFQNPPQWVPEASLPRQQYGRHRGIRPALPPAPHDNRRRGM